MLNFKQQGVDGNVKGVDFLLKKNKIDAHHRHRPDRRRPARSRSTAATARPRRCETKNIVIATGSDVARLKGIEIDEKRIVSSTGALALRQGAAASS